MLALTCLPGLTLKAQDTAIYTNTEHPPKFAAGDNELYLFIVRNTIYPEPAEKANIQGRVFVQFTVEKDGSVTGATILRGAHPLLDAEALRVTSLLPPFVPAKQDGKPVRCNMTLPFVFRLK